MKGAPGPRRQAACLAAGRDTELRARRVGDLLVGKHPVPPRTTGRYGPPRAAGRIRGAPSSWG